MQRFSRLDEYVNRFTDALLKDEYRVCALKKLISMNLTSETYRRFKISECTSLLLQAGACTELCKQLLQKIEKVAREERGCRKRAREQSSLFEEYEEPAGKKMKEGSQIEQYVDQLTDALVDDEKNREFSLKTLISLNLSTEIYERFEVGKLASVLIKADICTELCKGLLQKIEMVAANEAAGRKRAREQSSSSDEDEEPVCKKERIVPDEEEELEVPEEEKQLKEEEHLEEEQPQEEEQLEEDRQVQLEVPQEAEEVVMRRSTRKRVPKKIWENP